MSDFQEAIPALPTTDLVAATAFYRDVLEFQVWYSDSTFVSLERSDVEINLWLAYDNSWKQRSASAGVRSGAESFLGGTGSCRIRVTAISALYQQLVPLQIVHPNGKLETKPWGNKEFAVRDSDGNLITFFEIIERKS